jgi:hypothetical protein
MPRTHTDIKPEVGLEIAHKLAQGGNQRKAVIAKYTAPPWGWSASRVYKVAQTYGWRSGRKTRADKGLIRIPGIDEEKLEFAVRVVIASTRPKTGKRLTCTEDLIEQLVLNGYEEFRNMCPQTLNRLLRERGLSHHLLIADGPAIEMASLHPNHIHFVDASVCVQWDLRGSKKMVPRDMQKAFYKNKPGYWREVRKVLIRWLLVDHCSGMFYVDYTYAAGENTADLLNFLIDAWSVKPYSDRYPFHGVPKMLGLDPGAANTSHEVKALTEKLGVELYVHAPGNSRASGAVEVIHGYWERRFEWELLLKLADDLDDLRARAHDRMINLNATKEHARHGRTRCAKWMEITQAQLRILPPREHCHTLATCSPGTRVPDERLRITVDGRVFQLYAPALKGRKVNYDYNPWQVDELNVWTDDGEMVPCRLIRKNEHGFDSDAPVFGADEYKRHADTPAQRVRNTHEREDKATRLRGFEPKPTGHLVPKQHFIPKRGTPIVSTDAPKVPPIRAVEVPKRLREKLGLDRLTPLQNQQVLNWLGGKESVTAEEFDVILEKARSAWTGNQSEGRAVRTIQRAG